MKIDITDEPNRVEAEKQVSLKYPDKYFVPVWESKRFYMVDEEEIKKDPEHYRKLAGLIWFVIQNGFVTLKVGKLVV